MSKKIRLSEYLGAMSLIWKTDNSSDFCKGILSSQNLIRSVLIPTSL